ncbi:MAG TPA: hypothetical protein VM618_13270 [Acidimicrobiia bacterium]|jgi:hypothetical protein|nr:hypothetical protein [Acidimicrobiia bacterium]
MRLLRLTVTLLVVALAALTACGEDDDPGEDVQDSIPPQEEDVEDPNFGVTTTTGEDGTTTTATGTELATCQASQFTIGYPSDWSVNDEQEAEPCRWFHPEPFELPQQTEATNIAVHVDTPNAAYADILEGTTAGPDVDEVRSDEEMTIAGVEAHRTHYISSGEALLPAGTEVVVYVVDAPEGPIVMTTTGVAEGDFEANVDALDAMAGSLTFT